MKMIKKRIAVFLCMLMAFTSAAAFVPATQETVQAKEKSNYYLVGSTGFSSEADKLSKATSFIVIAKGMEGVSIADFVSGQIITGEKFQSIEGKKLSGVKYESKNPKIVSVDPKTGELTAKKTGKALIKVTWKGKKVFGAFRVVDTKTIKAYQKDNKTAITMAKKLDKLYAGKVTSKNVVKLEKQIIAANKVGCENYIYEYKYDSDNNYIGTDYIMYSEETYKAYMVIGKAVTNYFSRVNPFTTSNSCSFKISAISGKGTEVKATLPQKVTEDQLYGAQYCAVFGDDSALGKSSCSFDVYIRNVSNNDVISATATIKKGSKNITIKCDSYLSRGTKYELIQTRYYDEDYEAISWTHQGKCTFTAK
ncbi:MAG: Ig-like domain-containing protein [Agathobacter sp.]|nr:Ig-like domain-containing protein [Agathobacter sp.]